jgi:hypothetical protein
MPSLSLSCRLRRGRDGLFLRDLTDSRCVPSFLGFLKPTTLNRASPLPDLTFECRCKVACFLWSQVQDHRFQIRNLFLYGPVGYTRAQLRFWLLG